MSFIQTGRITIKYNYNYNLHDNIMYILHNKCNIPIEIVNKIIYGFNGVQHPIASMVKYGKGFTWSEEFKHTIFKIKPINKNYMFLFCLDRSEKLIRKKIYCYKCNKIDKLDYIIKTASYTNITKSQYQELAHNNISTSDQYKQYKSWTQTLLNLENKYGINFDNYICRSCSNLGINNRYVL